MSLKETLSTYWVHLQAALLPWLDEATDGPLMPRHKQLVAVLGLTGSRPAATPVRRGSPAARSTSSAPGRTI